jgi:hypothetical protein
LEIYDFSDAKGIQRAVDTVPFAVSVTSGGTSSLSGILHPLCSMLSSLFLDTELACAVFDQSGDKPGHRWWQNIPGFGQKVAENG